MRCGGLGGWMLALAVLVGARVVEAAPIDGWVVSLDAGVRRGSPRQDWYGLVSISMPLDRADSTDRRTSDDEPFGVDVRPEAGFRADEAFIGQPPRSASADDEPASPPRRVADEPQTGATPSDGSTKPADVPAPAPKATAAPARAPRLSPAFVRRVVREALRVRGLGVADARLDSMTRRARASAVLPEVRLRGARTTGESLRLSPTIDDPYRYVRGGDDELIVEARLSWRLDRLIFADEEVGVERLRRQDRAERAEWSLKVLATLFRWHRSSLRATDDGLLPEERAAAELDALEAEATLDVMTDGWFTSTVQ